MTQKSRYQISALFSEPSLGLGSKGEVSAGGGWEDSTLPGMLPETRVAKGEQVIKCVSSTDKTLQTSMWVQGGYERPCALDRLQAGTSAKCLRWKKGEK